MYFNVVPRCTKEIHSLLRYVRNLSIQKVLCYIVSNVAACYGIEHRHRVLLTNNGIVSYGPVQIPTAQQSCSVGI